MDHVYKVAVSADVKVGEKVEKSVSSEKRAVWLRAGIIEPAPQKAAPVAKAPAKKPATKKAPAKK